MAFPFGEGQKGILAAAPAIGTALLPKIFCAACWPAYTAALGTFGIGFFDYTPYMGPLMAAAILVALVSLALLAWRRRRIEPLLLGTAAAAAMLIGKFALDSNAVLYSGIAGLMVTSLFPWRSKASSCCS